MLPSKRLTKARIASIQTKYMRECDLSKLVAASEFDFFYEKSGATSIDVVSQIAGLSPHQYSRITSGSSIPSYEVYIAARARLENYFGTPQVNLARLRRTKRETAAKLVITETHKHGDDSRILTNVSTVSHRIASLTDKIFPPDHLAQQNEVSYGQWKEYLRETTGEDSDEFIDALGTFMCAREYLQGFVDKIIYQTKNLMVQNDEIACQLMEDINAIALVLASFRASNGHLKKVRRNLMSIRDGSFKTQSTDLEFINELLSRWQLLIADFLVPTTTVGFLLMESTIIRTRVLHVFAKSLKSERDR